MATVSRVTLTTTLISGSRTSRVTVRYRATFTPAEVAGNLRSRETIQLFGEDPPAGPAGDDRLFTFFPSRTVRPNGQLTRDLRRTTRVPNSVLDEDPGADEDEIYARVCLRSLDRTPPERCCARSGAISTLLAAPDSLAEDPPEDPPEDTAEAPAGAPAEASAEAPAGASADS